jgi:hypothetical protein
MMLGVRSHLRPQSRDVKLVTVTGSSHSHFFASTSFRNESVDELN